MCSFCHQLYDCHKLLLCLPHCYGTHFLVCSTTSEVWVSQMHERWLFTHDTNHQYDYELFKGRSLVHWRHESLMLLCFFFVDSIIKLLIPLYELSGFWLVLVFALLYLVNLFRRSLLPFVPLLNPFISKWCTAYVSAYTAQS